MAATGIVSPGCAVTPPPVVPDVAKPLPADPPAEKATSLDLENGTRSSKASQRIVLSGTDVQLERKDARTGRDSPARTTTQASTAAPTDSAAQAGTSAPPPVPEDEDTAKAHRLVESTRAPVDLGLDSALR